MAGTLSPIKHCVHCGQDFTFDAAVYRSCCDQCKLAGHRQENGKCSECQRLFKAGIHPIHPNVGRGQRSRTPSV